MSPLDCEAVGALASLAAGLVSSLSCGLPLDARWLLVRHRIKDGHQLLLLPVHPTSQASSHGIVCLICAALASGKTRRLVGRHQQNKHVDTENLPLRSQWRGGIVTLRSERVVLSH